MAEPKADKAKAKQWSPAMENSGEKINPSGEENKEMLGVGDKHINKMKDWFTNNKLAGFVNPTSHARSFLNKSRIGLKDNEILKNMTTEKEFWCQLVGAIAIKPFLDPEKVAKYLSRTRPGLQPCDSMAYRESRTLLQDIAEHGENSEWTTTRGMEALQFPAEEMLEAARMYGDAEEGMGTMPAKITRLLNRTGLAWMCVDPSERAVPPFWAAFLLKLEGQESQTKASKSLEGTLKRTTFPKQPIDLVAEFIEQEKAAESICQVLEEGAEVSEERLTKSTTADTPENKNKKRLRPNFHAEAPAMSSSDEDTKDQVTQSLTSNDDDIQSMLLPRGPRKSFAKELFGDTGDVRVAAAAALDHTPEENYSPEDNQNDIRQINSDGDGEENKRVSLADLLISYLNKNGEWGIGVDELTEWVKHAFPQISEGLGKEVKRENNEQVDVAGLVAFVDHRWNTIVTDVTYGLVVEVIDTLKMVADWHNQNLRAQTETNDKVVARIRNIEDQLEKEKQKTVDAEDRDQRIERLERHIERLEKQVQKLDKATQQTDATTRVQPSSIKLTPKADSKGEVNKLFKMGFPIPQRLSFEDRTKDNTPMPPQLGKRNFSHDIESEDEPSNDQPSQRTAFEIKAKKGKYR